MPGIKAFRGIHPVADFAAKVVLQLEGLSIEGAKSIRQENPVSYINMLVPKVDNPYLRGSKKEIAYKKINENFDDFLDKGILVRDEKPAIYIYQVCDKELTQTGIWAVTAIDDYLNNTVKKHELTRAEREKGLIEYLQQTGIDANPVLVTYRADKIIDSLILRFTKTEPILNFIAGAKHTLWKIDGEEEIQLIVKRFSKLKTTYIADGHHRAAAACSAGIERRKLNLKHKGDEEYNFFSTVYISANQLAIVEYNRLIKDTNNLDAGKLLELIGENFLIHNFDTKPVKPKDFHQFGMYCNGCWYLLEAKQHICSLKDPVNCLDVSILQNFILDPLLGIKDPRTDARLNFFGGLQPVEELVGLIDKGEFAIAFILYPTSIEQLIAVANAGEVMPPKSTWFEPKFHAGLLVHEIH